MIDLLLFLSWRSAQARCAAQFNNREVLRKLCHDGVKCVSSIGKFSDNVRAHARWACGSRVGVCLDFQERQEMRPDRVLNCRNAILQRLSSACTVAANRGFISEFVKNRWIWGGATAILAVETGRENR